ncbi:hypothetical protein [Aurantibacillus circumpalustris]|uniref:hypothetical protein n=1 Tax=Aurantibacillus circumpalustris TaxID=3036359 RepID=UPI00295B3E3F|nr:hypothetical protein [Aurantibacillus circumpalustris]
MKIIKSLIFLCCFCACFAHGRALSHPSISRFLNSNGSDTLKALKIKYGGIQQVGLIFGDRRSSTCFNFVNGIRFSRFFTGIGFDAQLNRSTNYYYENNTNNTTAAYLDLRYYINKKKNFFVVANGGANFIIENMDGSFRYSYKKLPGYYTALGLGFKARLGKEVFYSFDLSYSIKQIRYNYNYTNFLNEWQTDKYDIRQYSILLRMGIEIF